VLYLKPDFETLYIFDKLTDISIWGSLVEISCDSYKNTTTGETDFYVYVLYSKNRHLFTISDWEDCSFHVLVENHLNNKEQSYCYSVVTKLWYKPNKYGKLSEVKKDFYHKLHPDIAETLPLLEKIFKDASAPSSITAIKALGIVT
jgi:hypothetical protein